ncbi:MAG: zinc-ribbon domain containing protein [Chloroflexi bacterium]|nr:zinc-ribbon domain containing protein [Chloroflexota bacterium]
MSFVDKSIKCSDCGSTFTFSTSEQEFFAQKGYTNDPKRCPVCRASRKTQANSSSGYNEPRRQMFPVVCADCGKQTEVPFEPREGRPVYCSDCYSKVRTNTVRV